MLPGRIIPASILLIAAGSAFAQGLRCDLVGRDTTIAGNLGKACLDIGGLEGLGGLA